jgi:tetratricopeptide (TPR) repeat protein
VYYAQHDFGQAEHYYKKALRYTREDAVIYCNLGTAYFAEKKYDKGKKEYRKAFALDSNVFSPSQTAIVEAASSREQRVALNYYLAQTYAEAGQQEQALTFLRKALDEGFNDRKRLHEDKEFAVLRDTPQFKDLLAQENLN